MRSKFLLSALLGLTAGLALLPSQARAWWNDDWSLRKPITLDTSAAGGNVAEAIGRTPVLLRLHVGNFKFDAAKADGSDLRLIAGDDKTPLKFQIEKFDSLLGEAFVWVDVPDLKPGAQTTAYLYYGNAKAAPAEDKGAFDADTVLAYHFAERGQPARDATAFGNNAQTAGLPSDGAQIGAGLRLDGQSLVTIPGSGSLGWSEGAAITWSAWVKPAALQPNAVLFSRRDGANGLAIGLDNGVPFVEISRDGVAQRSTVGTVLTANSWHHLAVVTGAQATLYLDGNPVGAAAAALPSLAGPMTLGGDQAAPGGGPQSVSSVPSAAPGASAAAAFVGELDELEISKVGRPAGFIRVAALGQGAEASKFLSLGGDEETSSWSGGYFGVILHSVTLDGWVVIGILLIMAAISWVVMAEKAMYVGRVGKANLLFHDAFRHVAGDLTVLDKGDAKAAPTLGGKVSEAELRVLRDSSLYRLYHIAVEELRGRANAGRTVRGRALSAEALASIRASLDSGLVRETQRLNRLMVLLTIAISGGPFLGLLGTVVGVMITFAAIAASGDVNVNAIAPGIAAALVATVAGLFVAIPALFGYNYLISRIKDASADMQVFVDVLLTKTAEAYHRRAEQQAPADGHPAVAE